MRLCAREGGSVGGGECSFSFSFFFFSPPALCAVEFLCVVCGRSGMGLIKDFLELYQTVSCHRPSPRFSMRRLDGEVIARLDKILQEAPSNRELKEKEKSRKDLGEATWKNERQGSV